MQSAWQRGKEIEIHGWIYGLNNGLIHDLNCGCGGDSCRAKHKRGLVG
jgi:carbonic anhydrase